RLARKLATQETILEQFRSAKITVYDSSGNDLTNDEDPTRVLIRQVLGAVAQFDRHVTVLKLRAARERVKAKRGVCEGRKPFGFYEGESEVLREIRRLRRKPRGKNKRRMSWDRIAKELNRRGVPTRMGREWNPGTLLPIANRNRIS
ncbi:recombinase family protein, partial [Candidatus Eisenbacteria bacterium]